MKKKKDIMHISVKPLNYKEAIRFHGHSGPFLALGFVLGRHILKTVKPTSIMDLRINVRVKGTKPFTCVVDGIQCSTWATFGKGNISITASRSTKMGVTVRTGHGVARAFVATKKALRMCSNQPDLEKASQRILQTTVSQLWQGC